MSLTILTNVQIVTAEEDFVGTITFDETGIVDISSGKTSAAGAEDGEGDLCIPGLIEMHTDNVEKHLEPRPGVSWPSSIAALLAHDTQMVGAGVTTVYDAISVGDYEEDGRRNALLNKTVEGIKYGTQHGLFRAEHMMHMRCEVCDAAVVDMFQPLVNDPVVRLVSLMDHTPGQRQWRDLSKMKQFHSKRRTYTDKELEEFVAIRLAKQVKYADKHRQQIIDLWRPRGLPMASHDDTTPEHIEAAVREGIHIAEFPTTIEAAQLASEAGMRNVMGSPNLVRGGSHSGNVSAKELADNRILHALSSDYMPISLLHAAVKLNEEHDYTLANAIATVTKNVADMLSLHDRGELKVGKRADIVKFKRVGDGSAAVSTVYRQGVRVL